MQAEDSYAVQYVEDQLTDDDMVEGFKCWTCIYCAKVRRATERGNTIPVLGAGGKPPKLNKSKPPTPNSLNPPNPKPSVWV